MRVLRASLQCGTSVHPSAAAASVLGRTSIRTPPQSSHLRAGAAFSSLHMSRSNQVGREDDANIFRFISQTRTVSVLGVPLAHGQPLQGVDKGPVELRNYGLIKAIQDEDWMVRDLGDLSIPSYDATLSSDDPQNELYRVKYPVVGSRVKYPQIIGKVNYDTFKVIHEEAKNDRFALTLGGDHSVAMGSIAGVLAAKPDTAVIWVDAHADINTPVHSLSGNVHGMAAAFLLKHPECDNIIGYDWLKDVPILPTNRLVYIGLRDLDKHERKTIRAMGIKAFTMHDVDRHGIGKVMEMAMDHVCSRVDRPIHLTLDIDGVDPMFAPSTGTRVGGGLTYREAYYLCEAVADTGLLTSMDIVEVNPTLSNSPNEASRTCQMAVGLVSAALGNRIL